jgi:plasmid stabilization system protein ParE
MKYRLSRRADADIERICDYIAVNNPDAADRFDKQIHQTIRLLAKFPWNGTYPRRRARQALSLLGARKIRHCLPN